MDLIESIYYPHNPKSKQMNGNVCLTTKPTPPETPRQDETGLLAKINSNQPCCCEVVSRALRTDDLPQYLGMTSRRAALQIGEEELLYCNPDINYDDQGEATTNSAESSQKKNKPSEKK